MGVPDSKSEFNTVNRCQLGSSLVNLLARRLPVVARPQNCAQLLLHQAAPLGLSFSVKLVLF